MKKLLIALAWLLPCGAAAALLPPETNFGFCPSTFDESELIYHGSGKNNTIDAMIRISAADMPQIAKIMVGREKEETEYGEGWIVDSTDFDGYIVGVRCNLRVTPEQQSQIQVAVGTPDNIVATKSVWLRAGWNEVRFAEPIAIGAEDLYVGYRVFESQGLSGHHPVSALPHPAPSATNFINAGLTGWQDNSATGSMLIQAIIEGLYQAPNAATATVYGAPLVVAPSAPFEAMLNIVNMGYEPIHSLTVDYGHGSTDLTVEIPAGAAAQVPVTLTTSAEQSSDVPFVTSVTAINGSAVTPAYASTTHLYVTDDVFTRIPLIEEFTGLTCSNCPFMAYYLEQSRTLYNKPHTYVAHHAGFQKDELTQPIDDELTFLFTERTFNPAVMYDRSLLPGMTDIVTGATADNAQHYLDKLLSAEMVPALAGFTVEVNGTDVTVAGKVSTGSKTADGKVFISAYMVEDDIVPSAQNYPQNGVSYLVDPYAPDDMVSSFRHNGVIRANLCANTTGDPLQFDSEGLFSHNYTLPRELGANEHVVALVHRFDPADRTDCYVLNSADSKPFEESSIAEVTQSKGLQVVRALDGSIVCLTPVRSFEVYTPAGARVNPRHCPTGLYLIRATLPDGTPAATKSRL